MLRAVLGATIARVTPSARLTEMVEFIGLTAGATSIAALNGPPGARSSVVPSADRSTSLRPRREKPPMIPGVTHLPRASMISAPRGIGMPTPGAEDLAVLDDDRPADDRIRPVAKRDGAAGNGDGLGGERGRAAQQGGRDQEALHLVSPSPGWPSSKSLTGRSRGLALSYIRAPSIHTLSGRV